MDRSEKVIILPEVTINQRTKLQANIQFNQNWFVQRQSTTYIISRHLQNLSSWNRSTWLISTGKVLQTFDLSGQLQGCKCDNANKSRKQEIVKEKTIQQIKAMTLQIQIYRKPTTSVAALYINRSETGQTTVKPHSACRGSEGWVMKQNDHYQQTSVSGRKRYPALSCCSRW